MRAMHPLDGPRLRIKGRAFKNATTKNQPLSELPKRHIAMFERMQPYKRGNGFRSNPLFLLHHLNIADKHRTIQIMGTGAIGGWTIMPAQPLPAGFQIRTGNMPRRRRPLIDGAKLGEAQIIQPVSGPKVNVQPSMVLHVNFAEGCGAVKNRPVVRTLRSIAAEVSKIVDSFASEFTD